MLTLSWLHLPFIDAFLVNQNKYLAFRRPDTKSLRIRFAPATQDLFHPEAFSFPGEGQWTLSVLGIRAALNDSHILAVSLQKG